MASPSKVADKLNLHYLSQYRFEKNLGEAKQRRHGLLLNSTRRVLKSKCGYFGRKKESRPLKFLIFQTVVRKESTMVNKEMTNQFASLFSK